MPCGVVSALSWKGCIHGDLLSEGCKSELCPEVLLAPSSETSHGFLWPTGQNPTGPYSPQALFPSCHQPSRPLPRSLPTDPPTCQLLSCRRTTVLLFPLSRMSLLPHPAPVSDGGNPCPSWVSEQKGLPLHIHTHTHTLSLSLPHLRRTLECPVTSTCVFSA